MTKTIFTLNTYTEVLFILITSLFTRIFYGEMAQAARSHVWGYDDGMLILYPMIT